MHSFLVSQRVGCVDFRFSESRKRAFEKVKINALLVSRPTLMQLKVARSLN